MEEEKDHLTVDSQGQHAMKKGMKIFHYLKKKRGKFQVVSTDIGNSEAES